MLTGDFSALFGDAEVLDTYTRAQAIDDGTLVDVTDQARQLGFRCPVALTRAVWADCVEWDDLAGRRTGTPQDETGRLHDVLWMTYLAVRRAREESRVPVELHRIPRDGRPGNGPQSIRLEAVCGPGDERELVITIQQPGED